MPRGRAVDADPADAGTVRELGGDLLHRGAVREVRAVPAGEGHPRRRRVIELFEQPAEHPPLTCGRDRLDRQEIGARPGEDLEPPRVEGRQRGVVRLVVAGVFGAVGEEGAVGADARGHQRGAAPCPVFGIAPEAVSFLHRKLHREAKQPLGLLVRESVPCEPREARLVGGRDDAVGAGLQESAMDGPDGVRLLDQHFRGPEGVVEVEPIGLQFGGEPTVEDEEVGEHAALHAGRRS